MNDTAHRHEVVVNYQLWLVLFLFSWILLSCKKNPNELVEQPNYSPQAVFVHPNGYQNFWEGDTILFAVAAHDFDGKVEAVWFYKNGDLYFVDTITPWEVRIVYHHTQSLTVSAVAVDDDNTGSQRTSVIVYTDRSSTPGLEVRLNDGNYYEGDSLYFPVTEYHQTDHIKKIDYYLNDILIRTDSVAKRHLMFAPVTAGMYRLIGVAETFEGLRVKTGDVFFEVLPNPLPTVEIQHNYQTVQYPGRMVTIGFTVRDENGKVTWLELFANDSLIYSGNPHNVFAAQFLPWGGGTYFIRAIATDNNGDTGMSEILPIEVIDGFTLPDPLIELTAGSEPDEVYGLDQQNNRLLKFSPYQSVYDEISLPYPQPVKMTLIENENLMYILYKTTPKMSIMDLNQQTFTELDLPPAVEYTDMEIDATHRRFYIATYTHLHILNLDSGELLSTTAINNLSEIALSNQILFGCIKNYNHTRANMYDVSTDQLIFLNNTSYYSSCYGAIVVNEEEHYFLIPGTSFSNSNLPAFNLNNPRNILGYFNHQNPNRFAFLCQDNQQLLTTSLDYYDCFLNIFDARSFELLKQIPIPESPDAMAITNANKERLIVKSQLNNWTEDFHLLYFLDFPTVSNK